MIQSFLPFITFIICSGAIFRAIYILELIPTSTHKVKRSLFFLFARPLLFAGSTQHNTTQYSLSLSLSLLEMAAATVTRGVQSTNSKLIKTVLHKSYHKESSSSSELKGVFVGQKGEEGKDDCQVDGNARSLWVPHHRTGIYYPKGHEKLMEDVPMDAAKSKAVHSFSSYDDVPDHLFNSVDD
ncbi:hypothetical protein NE237_025536 [Protea cynaroides]|uniref:Late embryogenesis abundant protein n=1 Tax=Protea cynaroides TaxID=273540 RepID=A0A9Q0H386_9MAGN|nr:hypothetical protein NE237_025536 [Protea cynaroides]